MKCSRGLLLLMLCLFSTEFFSQSAVCAYKYRKRITFNPALVSGPVDLVDFPALISISGDANLKSVANSGHMESGSGFDVYFTASDGVTRLEYQLQKYTANTGDYMAWVKIPILSTTYSTTIYMYYGNTAITTDQSQTSTWNSTYKGVWHLDNDVFADAGQNGNTATNNGSSNLATAKILGGRSFSGAGTNYMQLPLAGMTGGSGRGSITFWGLVNTNVASTYFFGESTSQTGGTYTNRVQIYIADAGGNLALGLGGNHTLQTGIQALSTATWYHIGLSWSTTGAGVGTYSILVNGVQKGSANYSAFTAIHTFGDAGNDGNASQRTEELTGSIDEVHINNTALTPDWITTEYNNQNNPSAFYVVSAEPKVWNGGTNNNYNAATNWLNNASPSSGDDVIINNGTNQPTLQGNEQVYGEFIRTGATLSLGSKNLSVRSDITNCGTITGNSGMVTLNSSTSFLQAQSLSGSGTYNLNDLTVNNTHTASPSVTLNKDVNVAGALALTSGIVYTSGTNILALGTGATSTSGSASSFVSGPMSKAGNSDFVFPIGKAGLWRRAAVTSIASSVTFKAEYFNNRYVSTSPVNAPLNNVSTLEYWQVDQIVGTANAKLSLYWENATTSDINNCPDLTIGRWNGASWDERPATTVGGSSCSGAGTGIVTTNAVLTAFSPFTFASKTSTLNTLPIGLTEFSADCNNYTAQLHWATASEKNNRYFVIEKSADGNHWLNLSRVPGAGNSYNTRNYVYTDPAMIEDLTYYRLLHVDEDGTQTADQTIVVDCENSSTADYFLVYPNPSGNEINAVFNQNQDGATVTVKIIDNLGRICLQQAFNTVSGKNTLHLQHQLLAGSYSILLGADNMNFRAQKLIVK